MDESNLIEACKRKDPAAQRALYDRFGPILFSIAKRYVKMQEDAEDVFLEGMFKILTKIRTFKGKGSFEGWMKRIMVNEALMHLRKNSNFNLKVQIEDVQLEIPSKAVERLSRNEIMDTVEQLPTGYRTVFNLYEIEGYKHREIAEMLGISINTSKSQLILAKKRLQEMLKKKTVIRIKPQKYDRLSSMA